MISLNHNLSASQVANNLQSHYSRLQTSTQRLSSGLRINGASDDAAGLAIREQMRSDIVAYRQGMRNVNDGISMIQTVDGALGVIDEKLIRMKELAEQAATGTYDSTQRLMIASEFQAMGDEINRIARATDFNGIKLIDGAFVSTDTEVSVGSDGRTYSRTLTDKGFVNLWPGTSAQAKGAWVLDGPVTAEGEVDLSKIVGSYDLTITNTNIPKIGDNYLLVTPQNHTTNVPPGTTLQFSFNEMLTLPDSMTYGEWTVSMNGVDYSWNGLGSTIDWNGPAGIHIQASVVDMEGKAAKVSGNQTSVPWTSPGQLPAFTAIGADKKNYNVTVKIDGQTYTDPAAVLDVTNGNVLSMVVDLGNGYTLSRDWELRYGTNVYEPSTVLASSAVALEVKDTTPASDEPVDPDDPLSPNYQIPDDVIRIHFGPGADKKEDFYDIKKYDATLKGLGLDGVAIQTQEDAQNALVQINDAIVAKDKIRADYGAMQNRMENTLTNLSIQAENLQTAEARISDAEVAQTMMEFVRQQILSQSAVAMLAQANSVPQMVMALIR